MTTTNTVTPMMIVSIDIPTYSWMPAKAMKPMAISPVTRKVIPSPRRAGGTFE